MPSLYRNIYYINSFIFFWKFSHSFSYFIYFPVFIFIFQGQIFLLTTKFRVKECRDGRVTSVVCGEFMSATWWKFCAINFPRCRYKRTFTFILSITGCFKFSPPFSFPSYMRPFQNSEPWKIQVTSCRKKKLLRRSATFFPTSVRKFKCFLYIKKKVLSFH